MNVARSGASTPGGPVDEEPTAGDDAAGRPDGARSEGERRRGRPRQGGGEPPAAGDGRPIVNALARGLSILRSFRAEDRVLGTQEIARRAGLPKATASRLAQTLTELGYLRFVPEVGKYALSSQVLTLGYATLGRSGIAETAKPFLDELASTGEFASALSVRDGLDMMFVELVRRPQAIMLNLQVGSRVPIHVTAPGRAWLMLADAAERRSVFDALAERHGAGWPALRDALEAALDRAARCGYAESVGEWRPEHNAIATALRDPITRDIYVFSIGGLASVLPRHRLETALAPRILDAAQTIASRLRGFA
ncbi:IclR family transcriptional regulator [Azospirillum sp. ST 5-10]|uniref:IclR family transcriptional regulator n=1 Tax=unclassified Azospirillum TaxID=2630922 RepID=UPI003F4A2EFE